MSDEIAEEPDARRVQIARIALPLFLERGYAATSMSAVARAVGVRKASLYHHFASKEALFVAALSEDVAPSLRAIRDLTTRPDLPAGEAFSQALGLFYDAMVNSQVGAMMSVIAETSAKVPAVAAAFHDEFILAFRDVLHAVHAPAVAAGFCRELPRHWVEDFVFSPLVNMAMTRMMFQSHPPARDRWYAPDAREDYVRMMLAVLR